MVNEFSSSMVRNCLHVAQILFSVVHILLYIPKTFFNIIYFVGIVYHITCTFAADFSINFLCVDAYSNSLPGCSSHEEFINKFAYFLMNEIEIIRSQCEQSNWTVSSVCLLWPVFLFRYKYDVEVMFRLSYGYGTDIFKRYKYTCYFIQLCKGISHIH